MPIATTIACASCGISKPHDLEHFAKEGSRLRIQCRPCRAAQKRRRRHGEAPEARERRLAALADYAKRNAAAVSQQKKRWADENKNRVQNRARAYYLQNPERAKAKARAWKTENRDRVRILNRSWVSSNPEKQRLSEIVSKRKRRLVPLVRISEAISRQMWSALRDGKDGRSWETLVGYSRQELLAHIELQFVKGMSWANYGEWHIDHIRPVSSFSFTSFDCPDFKDCWALTNLRPLWAAENIAKGAKRLLLV